MPDILVLIGAFAVSAVLTGLLRRYALKTSLLDIPNQRSSHSIPTPRGGGLAIVAVFIVTSIGLVLTDVIGFDAFWAVFGGGLIVSVISYWDDLGHISARWRFLVHVLAAWWVIGWLGSVENINLGFGVLDLGWFGAGLTILFTVWMLNLYNFMDGIDGIAGVQAVSNSVGMAIILWYQEQAGTALWLAGIGVTSAGFLVWNWPPAKIFMGDVGSSFLGFAFATFAILTHNEGGASIWVWLIMCGVFVVDASFTLFRRMIGGQRWYAPHRTHAYQWASRQFGSHKAVTTAVLGINVLWLFPLAWYSAVEPELGLLLVMTAYIPLLLLAIKFRAGVSESVSV